MQDIFHQQYWILSSKTNIATETHHFYCWRYIGSFMVDFLASYVSLPKGMTPKASRRYASNHPRHFLGLLNETCPCNVSTKARPFALVKMTIFCEKTEAKPVQFRGESRRGIFDHFFLQKKMHSLKLRIIKWPLKSGGFRRRSLS